MSITTIATNVNSLMAQNQMKILDTGLQTTMRRLSTGLRINSGADAPADLAIANSMTSHLRGLRTAVQNAEDGLSMLQFADSTLNQTMDILQRMNELSVRAANQAVITSADIVSINNEIADLKTELDRKSRAIEFNSKVLFSGGFSAGGTVNAPILQIGPDNATNNQLTVEIYGMTLSGLFMVSGVKGPNYYGVGSLIISNYATAGLNQSAQGFAMQAIDWINSAINFVSDMQAALGVQERNLGSIIDDLNAQDVNLAAAKSRITDADMAAEISEFTRLQVMTQSATAMLAQANLQPSLVASLLGTSA